METLATIHPALVAVRQTPEYAALIAEFELAAAQTYGGEAWTMRRRKAQGAMFHLERQAVELWDAAPDPVTYRAVCRTCETWSVPLPHGGAVKWTEKHAKRCKNASTEISRRVD